MQHPSTFFVGLAALALAAVPARAWAQVGSRIDCPPRAELQALRPLAERGAAALVYYPDAGPGARISVVVPVAAPLATVRRALLDAERWPDYMPALRGVTLLSRRGRRAAYRFEVNASLLDVTATTSLVEVGERRVDFTVQESEFGPAAARWDMIEESPTRTLLVITSWSDPSQGHWLLRRAASSNPSATAGMNVAVDLTLALSVARRATALTGVALPARPARTSAPTGELRPPTVGPWVSLTHRYYVYSFDIAPDGAVAQMSVVGQTWGRADVLRARLEDIGHYSEHVPGVRLSRAEGDTTSDRVRATFSVNTPFDTADGTLVRRRAPDGAIFLDGDSGAFAQTGWRWDVIRDPEHGVLLALTGGVEESLASVVTRAAAGREPYLYAGVSALRKLVWLRYMLAGIPFPT